MLLDASALAVVKILADQLIARPANLRLLVVAIKYKAPPRIGGIRDQIAVLVKGIALPAVKRFVLASIAGWVRFVCAICDAPMNLSWLSRLP